MKGILVSGGKVNRNQLKKILRNSHFVIAVDSGLRALKDIGVIPNLLVGDLDSIDEVTFNWSKEKNLEVLKFPIQKDQTDTEIAVDYLVEKKTDEIVLLGCTGSRLDHMLSNISLLRKLSKLGIEAKIVDENNEIRYLNSNVSIEKKDGQYISVVPISLDGIILTLRGFYYNLEHKDLEYSTSLGISNYIVNDIGQVILEKGEALLIISRD